jgi:hypothetical protein
MFICNHGPFVQAVLARIARDARELQALGIGVAAICANDAEVCPAYGFEAMRALATAQGFSFPDLHDADKSVARRYGAVCTPDFFGFNRDLGLQYRGRLDASGMREVARTGRGPAEQIAAIGCSIKWAPWSGPRVLSDGGQLHSSPNYLLPDHATFRFFVALHAAAATHLATLQRMPDPILILD